MEVDLKKRKKWQSKLQHIMRHVIRRSLAIVSRVLSFLKEQVISGKKNPSRSETALSVEIPDDIAEEILHRVRANDLVRLKTVSKHWKALIESGYLVEKHLRRRQKIHGVEECKITLDVLTFHVTLISKYSRLRRDKGESRAPRVSGSCNGLVCVYDLVDVYIANPSTGVSRKLSRLQGITKLSAGFGRDVVTGAYKVVVLNSFGDDNRVECVVFDLSASDWRWRYKTAGPMPPSFTLISPERNPVSVNGSVFWLLTCDHGHPEILVMDLHTEEFRTVSLSLPKDDNHVFVSPPSGSVYMWSLMGRLCVSDLGQGLASDVWSFVQDELGERWEITKFAPGTVIPPLNLSSAWFSPTLVSPYQ
ncbi:putative F-box protein At1g33530 [Capsella rubella]|nr:putative F-box protein At1g33530 [Capsella rubella]